MAMINGMILGKDGSMAANSDKVVPSQKAAKSYSDSAAASAASASAIGSLIAGATDKSTPVDADSMGLSDSAASNVLKKLTWANLKATLKAYFDPLYTLDSVTSANGGSVTGPGLYIATGTNPFNLPTPVAGQRFRFRQANAGTNVIAVAPTATTYLEKPDASGYGLVGHSLVSAGANGDYLELETIDSTHLMLLNSRGTWKHKGAIDYPVHYSSPNGVQNIGKVAGNQWLATQFTTALAYALDSITLKLLKVGSPTGNINVYLYSDSGSNTPGSLLATASETLAASSLTGSSAEYVFTFSGYSLSSATKYWTAVKSSVVDVNNWVEWSASTLDNTGLTYASANGSSWTYGSAYYCSMKTIGRY